MSLLTVAMWPGRPKRDGAPRSDVHHGGSAHACFILGVFRFEGIIGTTLYSLPYFFSYTHIEVNFLYAHLGILTHLCIFIFFNIMVQQMDSEDHVRAI